LVDFLKFTIPITGRG